MLDWFSDVAARAVLALSLLLGGADVGNGPYEAAAQSTAQQQYANDPQAIEALRNLVEVAKRAEQVFACDQACKDGKEADKKADDIRNNRDVLAQEGMWFWARLMWWVVLVQTTVGGVTLWFLYKTFGEARKTTRAALDTAKIAERTLTELEAPTIYVDFKDTGLKVEGNGTFRAGTLTYYFVNFGRTPARLVAYHEEVELVAQGSGLPPPLILDHHIKEELPWGALVPPNGKSDPISLNLFAKYLADDRLRNPKSVFFLLVAARYEDIFGLRYSTGFCFQFDKHHGVYVLSGKGHPYSYLQKEEKEQEAPRPKSRGRRFLEALGIDAS